ncbi:MAG TPA: efflux RND transporter periplasmic adaptor subunit [Anaerolineales bacterium]|nr:efflux RND transporter periplasmic adaptor subunit [Anaerolineales bacterium]
MERSSPSLPVRILLVLVVLGIIAYFALRSLNPADNGQLNASGTIESVTVNISPEMAGKVKAVLIEEGQSVRAGDPLLSLDDSLLAAQRAVASAQLDSARAALAVAQAASETAQRQYDITYSSALAAEQATRLAVWSASRPPEFSLPVWYFSKQERMDAAQARVDGSLTALQDAQKRLDDIQQRAGSGQFLDIEAKMAQARIAFQTAQSVLDATSGASDSQDLRDAAQIVLDEAEIDLEEAQEDYDDALTTDGARDVLEARTDVIIAQEMYDMAVDQLRTLQTGAESQQVAATSKAVDQAKAGLEQAEAGVGNAQANLDLLDTQISKLTIYAPMDGIILTRNAEPGEFLQPGAVAFTMADLNNLTITVYVPEDQYGRISLGQQATVTVDSFPDESFNAEVIHIADQAEFTPRNVQTVEGRSATVYSIKLKVTDSEGKLKIGMPADVVFK